MLPKAKGRREAVPNRRKKARSPRRKAPSPHKKAARAQDQRGQSKRGKGDTTGQAPQQSQPSGQAEQGQTRSKSDQGRATSGESKGEAQRSQSPSQSQQTQSPTQSQQTQPQQGQTQQGQTQRGQTQQGAQQAQPSQGGGGSVTLTSEQRTKIRQTVLSGSNVPRVINVNFSVSVGTVVPSSVHVVAVPAVIVEIHPEWRGYYYFVVGDEIRGCPGHC